MRMSALCPMTAQSHFSFVQEASRPHRGIVSGGVRWPVRRGSLGWTEMGMVERTSPCGIRVARCRL